MSIEQDIIDLVIKYNGISILTFKRYKITLDTDLNIAFKMAPEDASELIEQYFDNFSVAPENFNLMTYFPIVGSFLTPSFLLPKKLRPIGTQAKPLTVRMLVESAKAGRWLYD